MGGLVLREGRLRKLITTIALHGMNKADTVPRERRVGAVSTSGLLLRGNI